MERFRNAFVRLIRGPAGGMLGMLLLAAMLSGVAAANPGDGSHGVALGQGPSENAQETQTDESQAPESDAPESEPPEQGSEAQVGPHSISPHSLESEAHTSEDCQGLVEGVDLPSAEDAGGLANAIAHVSANCEDNPTAPGLLVALDRLVSNFERHQALLEAKAAGEHGNSGHGNSGDHGPDAEHGNSGEHGPDAMHGHSAKAPGHALGS